MTVMIVKTEIDMSNKEWLEFATYDGNVVERPELEKVHGNFAADGWRVHITKGKPCECGNTQFHKSIQENVIGKAEKQPFLFAIQRKFLLEALAGISEDSDHIVFFGEKKSPIVIQGADDNSRVAIIMPLDLGGYQDDYTSPKIPKVYEGVQS